MSLGINEDIIEQIKSRCDIVDVIGHSVVLKKAGSNYKGLCPFHSEKTPSFVVSGDKQIFTCFGCGATGDVIEFVKRNENLDFQEAVEKLSERYGIEMPKSSYQKDNKKNELYEINREAAKFYYKNLRLKNNDGLRYIIKRGIDAETAEKFGIGYAGPGWQDLENSLKDINPEMFLELGLLSKSKSGYYDKFRNRVIFPIINTRGKVIGFGGRSIDNSNPKYLNSPESVIFEKKNNLYGLNLTRQAISKSDSIILVEGYMDVLALFQMGVQNVAASLGTALTQGQAVLIKRYTNNVTLAYDSDAAGQAATLRAIDILQSAGCKVRILLLDEGKDPDEFIRKNGKKAFEELIDKAISSIEYKVNGIKAKYDINTTDGSIRFLEEVAEELKKVSSPIEQETYIQKIAAMTRMPASTIRREIETKNGIKKPQYVHTENDLHKENYENQPNSKTSALEKGFIRLMLANGDYIKKFAEENDAKFLFDGSRLRNIYNYITRLYEEDKEIDIKKLRDCLEETDNYILSDILDNILLGEDYEKLYMQWIQKIKTNQVEKREKEILKVLQILDEEADKIQIENLSRELMDINNKKTELPNRKG